MISLTHLLAENAALRAGLEQAHAALRAMRGEAPSNVAPSPPRKRYRLADVTIAWTPVRGPWADKPTQGKVVLAPRPPMGATQGYAMCICPSSRSLDGDAGLARLFILFNTLVVRDGLDPDVVNAAFLGIDEYAWAVAPDQEGARERPFGDEE